MFRIGIVSFALLAFGCNDQSFSCEDERVGDWAIQFTVAETTDGLCSYTGTVTRQESNETRELLCEASGAACICSGGDEFGVYEVIITNDLDQTQRALLEVMPESSPICLSRRALEEFDEFEAGGMGGAGGASVGGAGGASD